MFCCSVLFFTNEELTGKQLDKQPVSAASASHLHHREERQHRAQPPATLFLMKYNCWSTSAEDRLFNTTLCIHTGWPNPVSLGTAGVSLLLALRF